MVHTRKQLKHHLLRDTSNACASAMPATLAHVFKPSPTSFLCSTQGQPCQHTLRPPHPEELSSRGPGLRAPLPPLIPVSATPAPPPPHSPASPEACPFLHSSDPSTRCSAYRLSPLRRVSSMGAAGLFLSKLFLFLYVVFSALLTAQVSVEPEVETP